MSSTYKRKGKEERRKKCELTQQLTSSRFGFFTRLAHFILFFFRIKKKEKKRKKMVEHSGCLWKGRRWRELPRTLRDSTIISFIVYFSLECYAVPNFTPTKPVETTAKVFFFFFILKMCDTAHSDMYIIINAIQFTPFIILDMILVTQLNNSVFLLYLEIFAFLLYKRSPHLRKKRRKGE